MPGARKALEEWVAGAGYRPADEHFGAQPELGLADAYLAERSDDYVTEIQLLVIEG